LSGCTSIVGAGFVSCSAIQGMKVHLHAQPDAANVLTSE
jgi:hypothetical protein